MPQVKEKKGGLEKVELEAIFDVNITGRCNFRCKFCYQAGRGLPKDHMALQEFKDLIFEIEKLSKRMGKNFRICIAGGEPFLNPHAVEMAAFAVKHLGRRRVDITTNASKLPTDKEQVKQLIIKMGRPKINLSIDREHLRFGNKMPERIRAVCAAAKELKSRIGIINVAQNKYQQKKPWPREVARAIPQRLKKRADVRLEPYSAPSMKELYEYLEKAAAGKKTFFPMATFMHFPISMLDELSLPVKLYFIPGGKVFMGGTPDALHSPQFSIGNWKRESLQEVVDVNLPFKRNFLRTWFGYTRRSQELNPPKWGSFDLPNKRKQQLFAQYALRRFKAQRKRRLGK